MSHWRLVYDIRVTIKIREAGVCTRGTCYSLRVIDLMCLAYHQSENGNNLMITIMIFWDQSLIGAATLLQKLICN